jgi:hypothetical protein
MCLRLRYIYTCVRWGVQIVSRRRGFTVETCTAVVPAAKESPTFQGLSAGQRVPTPPFHIMLLLCSHDSGAGVQWRLILGRPKVSWLPGVCAGVCR